MSTVYETCPCCSCRFWHPTQVKGVFVCNECEAVFGECSFDDSRAFVESLFSTDIVSPEKTRYYHFTIPFSGVRCGWYDPRTGLITQAGW